MSKFINPFSDYGFKAIFGSEVCKNLIISFLNSVLQNESMRYMQAFQEIIISELEREGSIMLQGFGIFSPWQQSERPGRNPRNGTPCMIPKRMSVKFKP